MEAIVVSGLVAAGLWPLWSAARLAGLGAWRGALVGLGLALAAATAWAVWSRPAVEAVVPDDRPVEQHGPGHEYLSSDTCRACHPAAHASWHASFHRRMTRPATPEHVLPEIDELRFEHRGDRLRLARRGERYFAAIADGVDAQGVERWVEREIVQTTGAHHTQLFWFSSGRGRELTLFPIGYRVREQRWMPIDAAFLMPPDTLQPLGGARWNTNCIQCHTTGGQPRIDDGGVDTRVAELGIACEACHGPAAEHVAANRDPLRRYRLHLASGEDPTIVNPARLPPDRSAEVCGQCHGVTVARLEQQERWAREGHAYRPGDELFATRVLVSRDAQDAPELQEPLRRSPELLDSLSWPDGQIRVSGREYHGLIASPCYADAAPERRMTCLSCHELHPEADDRRPLDAWAEDQLAPGMRGDRGCTQCHGELADPLAAREHSGHEAGSAGCYDCHMPYTTYGLLKAIRSHTVTVPSAGETTEHGRLNACSQCHLDRPLGWVADRLAERHGIPAPPLSDDDRRIAVGVVHALRGDAGQRALVAWSLGHEPTRRTAGTDWIVPYLAELMRDPYHAVRFVAAESMRTLPGQAGSGYDFLAPPAAREHALARLVDGWARRGRIATRDRRAVLVDADGALQHDEYRRLLSQRDLRAVFLGE